MCPTLLFRKKKVKLDQGSHSWPHFKLITSTRTVSTSSGPTASFLLTAVTGLGLGSTMLKCPKWYNILQSAWPHWTSTGIGFTWRSVRRATPSMKASPTAILPSPQPCSHPKALAKLELSSTLSSRSSWGNSLYPLRYMPRLPQDSRSCQWPQFPQ